MTDIEILSFQPPAWVLRELRNKGLRWSSLTSKEQRLVAEAVPWWERLTQEERHRMNATGGFLPTFAQRGRIVREEEKVTEEDEPFAVDGKHNGKAMLALPAAEETAGVDTRYAVSQTVLRVLYTLTGSRHPDLRLATDCLLAIINYTEEKSGAAIARKYKLTRAAVNKRMQEMRKGRFLNGLEVYFFGGKPEDSERARERATRVHKQQKLLCKPTTKAAQAASSFLESL